MKLPNRKYAYIPRSKLKDYLFSETHVIGRTKAKLMHMFGFYESNIDLLEQGLIRIAQNQEVIEDVSSPHGKKYIIDGLLDNPINRPVKV